MSNFERPNVVAPRPVRVANPFFPKDDLRVSFYADIADIADKHSPDRPRWVSYLPTLLILTVL